MADRLADETLSDILAQCLAVRDEDFACTTASKSPFASDALSSSALLLVCKRWMRVATPLLYETVILRSVPQAVALAAALKANTDFGRYIKKVRVEGGVGASICLVFKAAPNITDLALTLDLYSGDKVVSMYKSLRESVAPRRLVLCSALQGLNANKVTALAVETLCKGIAEWPTLRVVVLPELLAARSTEIFGAICQAPQLHMIHIPMPYPDSYGYGYLSRLAEQCAASVVRVGWPARGPTTKLGIPNDRLASLSPRARVKVQFKEPQNPKLRPDAVPTNPTFTPLQNCTEETRRKILEKILGLVIAHTTGVDEEKLAQERWNHVLYKNRLPRGPVLQCMLVSKEWKEIATALACRTVVLPEPHNVLQFVRVVFPDENSTLHLRVRSLRLCGYAYMPDQHAIFRIEKHLHELLEQFYYLEHFDSAHISVSPAAFNVLTDSIPRFLRSLSMRSSDPGVYTVRSLLRLTSLRWNVGSSEVELSIAMPRPSFPALEELALSGPGSGRLLPKLALCGMPALRALEFEDCLETELEPFLAAHGRRLRTVKNLGRRESGDMLGSIVAACPAATCVDVSHGRMPAPLAWPGPGLLPLLPSAGVRPALEIVLPSLRCLRYRATPREDDAEIAQLAAFLAQLLPERLPTLRTVRIQQGDIWPTAQRKLAKHPLPALAEKMLARGLRLVDGDGVGWKPRLTASTKKPA